MDTVEYNQLLDIYIYYNPALPYNTQTVKVMNKVDAVYQLKATNSELIFPREVSDNLLKTFGFHKAKIQIVELEDKKLQQYTKYEFGEVKLVGDNWYVSVTEILDVVKLNRAWDYKRELRNQKLLETDWIPASTLPQETKDKYELYRKLLRDCINIVQYPHEVVFPTSPKDPKVIYPNTSLTPEEVERIKDYNSQLPGWNSFLTEWSRYRFTNDYNFVNTLIKLHVTKELDLSEIIQ